MQYIYEEPSNLIERIVDYANIVQKDGMLSLEVKMVGEGNSFLKILLEELMLKPPLDKKNYNKFIESYVEELNFSEKEKSEMKKQMEMILHGAQMLHNEEPSQQIKKELYMFSAENISN